MEQNSDYFKRLCNGMEFPMRPHFINRICIGIMILMLAPILQGGVRIIRGITPTKTGTWEYCELFLGLLVEAICLLYMIIDYTKKRREYNFSVTSPDEYRINKANKFLANQQEQQAYEAEKYKKHKKKRTKLDDSGAFAYMNGGHLAVEWDPETKKDDKGD